MKVVDEDVHEYWSEFYMLDVLDDNIPDVWQIRKPLEGFSMLAKKKCTSRKMACGCHVRDTEAG